MVDTSCRPAAQCMVTYVEDSTPIASRQQIAKGIGDMVHNNFILIKKECHLDLTLEPYQTTDDYIYLHRWTVEFLCSL